MKKLMNVILGVCVLGTVLMARDYTDEDLKTISKLSQIDNVRGENKYYINFEMSSGSNGDETIFGKQPVDVIVGSLGEKTNFISFGLENEGTELGVTILVSPNNNNQYGVGGDFKFVSQKGFAGFKPYFGGKVLMASQSRDGDTVMLSYNENMVTTVTGNNTKKGRYKAKIKGDVTTFLIKSGVGVEREIGENIMLFASYDMTVAKHSISYRVDGSIVSVDTAVSQSSSGFMFGVGVKF